MLNTGTPIVVYAGYLPSSQTLLYTVPTGKILLVTEVSVVNRDSGPLTPDIRLVPAAESNDGEWAIHNSEMEAGEDRCIARGTVAVAADKIYGGDGDGANVATRISGVLFDAA